MYVYTAGNNKFSADILPVDCSPHTSITIKTHDSESRGQEEAGRTRDEQVSYLHVAPL